MNTEQERADFEAWVKENYPSYKPGESWMVDFTFDLARSAYQAGRAALQSQSSHAGWKEAAIAWEVCASLHREFCKGRDPLFKVRQADFVKHAEDARTRALETEALQSQDREDAQDIAATLATALHFIPKQKEPELYADMELLCARFSGHARRIEGDGHV